MKATPPRLSREEKKALTRRQLIDAAARVFARDGYEGASVDDVAAEAGYTKGAIYSNFGTKLELVLELLEDRCRAWCNRVAGAYLVEGDVGDWLESGARELTQLTEKEGDWYLLFVEIWTQAVRTPELRTRLAAIYEEARRRGAAVVESRSRELGVEPSVPPEVLATIFIAAP